MAVNRGPVSSTELAKPAVSWTRIRTLLNVTLQPLRGFESKVAGSGWNSSTEQIANDLDSLNRRTEQDFLTVGGKLVKVRSAARQIASDMTALGELISGKQGHDASHALSRVLGQTKDMEARMEQSGRTMEEVRELSREIREAFSGLAHRVFVFRTLCTLTQIETSRLGNSGVDFGDLAAQVRPLSESIQSSGEGILVSSARLGQGVQSAILISSSLKTRQRNELPALISGAIGNLKAFEERRQRAAQASARQADHMARCATRSTAWCNPFNSTTLPGSGSSTWRKRCAISMRDPKDPRIPRIRYLQTLVRY